MSPRLDVIILAAGLGTRMKSSRIKILHEAAGRPLIDYVVDLAGELTDQQPILVVGHQQDLVREHFATRVGYCIQKEQLGTAHAVLQAEEILRERGLERSRLLVLSGDVPLTRAATLQRLLSAHEEQGNSATLLTMKLDEPGGYGRVIRAGDGSLEAIVEARDATADQRRIEEVNAGIYVFDEEALFDALHRITPENVQGEYYLTDVIAILRRAGMRVGAVRTDAPIEALGVNSRAELAAVHRHLVRRKVEQLMEEGVTFLDPDSVSIDAQVSIGSDSIIYPYVTIEGASRIGRDCVVGPGVHLHTVVIGDRVEVRTGTVAVESTIDDDAAVGPYAHLRPGSMLGHHVRVGNFVETKKAVFGSRSKANHLAYIGDAEVGEDVNIGAGTITCNYDGVRKHKTIIEDGVFIGSDSQLVAPVIIGRGSYVGAGSTITKNVPADSLALSRSPQKVRDGWAEKRRKDLENG